jgi:prophage maintenance system killer protein
MRVQADKKTPAHRKANPPYKHGAPRPRKDKGVRMGTSKGEIVFYKTPDRSTAIEVRLEQDTVWLTHTQMAELFQRERSVITRHIRNVFAEKELGQKSNVQKMHIASADRPVAFYSLDVIISVGYRVNSRRGTQFRIWATRMLRDYLVRGYAANERRLKGLRQSLKLVQNVVERLDISGDEARALLATVADYAYALDLLDDYDHQRVVPSSEEVKPALGIAYEEALDVVQRLRAKFGGSDLFGRERDDSLKGSLAAILQTFGGKDLYPSLEAKAGHLLYFLVKNHSFVDGNKRIAASLFLWFMQKNGLLYRPDGSKRLADNALVALTIMIAASDPAEKDITVNLAINLINRKN